MVGRKWVNLVFAMAHFHLANNYLLRERMSKPFSMVSTPAGTAMVSNSLSLLPFSLLKPSLSSCIINMNVRRTLTMTELKRISLPWREGRNSLGQQLCCRRGMPDIPSRDRGRRIDAGADTWWPIWPNSDESPGRRLIWRTWSTLRSNHRWPAKSSSSCCALWDRWILRNPLITKFVS